MPEAETKVPKWELKKYNDKKWSSIEKSSAKEDIMVCISRDEEEKTLVIVFASIDLSDLKSDIEKSILQINGRSAAVVTISELNELIDYFINNIGDEDAKNLIKNSFLEIIKRLESEEQSQVSRNLTIKLVLNGLTKQYKEKNIVIITNCHLNDRIASFGLARLISQLNGLHCFKIITNANNIEEDINREMESIRQHLYSLEEEYKGNL